MSPTSNIVVHDEMNFCCKISGAASGIGSAICSKLAGEGASVVLVDRNQNKLKSKFTLLSDVNENNHHHICGDVSQSNFAEYVFQNVKVNCFLLFSNL